MTAHTKTAFITGITGFTGPYLQAALERAGIKVYGLTVSDPKKDQFMGDIMDKSMLTNLFKKTKPNYIFHLAGITHVQHANLLDFYRVNVLGTQCLLESLQAANHQPEKILVSSSANVYGNSRENPITEKTPCEPVNHYACSKLSMEYLLKTWFDIFPIIITRPFNYTGAKQSTNFLIPKIVNCFAKKEKIIELGNLEITRDYSDVRMLANAYNALIHSNSQGEIFNICSGVGHSIQDIIDTMESIAGYHITVKTNPAFIRKNDIKALIGDNQKLKQVMGECTQYTLKDTLTWMYQDQIDRQ